MKLTLIAKIAAAMTCVSGFSMISSPAQAGPAFYWWHMDLNLSAGNCAKRAVAAVSTEFSGGQLFKNKDNVFVSWANTDLLIYCASKGSKKSEAVIVATGSNGKNTENTMIAARDAMKSGIFE